ncbi:M23 family metallopeptidase [Paenibacillus eucommiae]|uniref:Murein DD-endopeptidase MepM/ murein hydrolase activator NlpD n=1 Tax=Paenibacillus eucommiae TaxID=1355755 RepID=A0ABS4ISG4_9BACL|nr:M23 family metallopeptidase [Paenibacillus eucommiae]MBP1990463.1 murein DD-endopeptidase MepM/ murein hydrolase activator NlpD [Paenibacillus eucommiae]
MNPQDKRHRSGAHIWQSAKFRILLVGVFLAAFLAVIVFVQLPANAPAPAPAAGGTGETGTVDQQQEPSPTVAVVKKVMVDFHMQDLQHGWIKYTDSAAATEDGGANWLDMAPEQMEQLAADGSWQLEMADWFQAVEPPRTVSFQAKEFEVKKAQFLTDRIGWALVSHADHPEGSLLVTTDGGATWVDGAKPEGAAPEIAAQLQAESQRIDDMKREAAYYSAEGTAKEAIRSDWTLLPAAAAPGDVVLVRHKEAGEVVWEGKTYTLKPFGSGYFTYVPISMSAKPGQYPIGDQLLTIKEKKFETQYLKVTKQMESMKQETDKINADQKKIDLARSSSAPEFLFSEPFIQPIEGILTTPFGYTRYVNGKLDSSHRAIDLAAKEGTPIKATNDGIVALAELLYLTGNAIYLDHGMGLFSQYAHLSELKVKPGDKVKKGDIIGLVGTTGFSTGPHLHFTFWAHNVPVNPNLFFDSSPFLWLLKRSS